MEKKYTIELKRTELDVVMKALGELPLKESMGVFSAINTQFIKQEKPEEPKEK